jgi:diadenosine tetraphosphate (Ap4A) HIT family hydrolase
VDKACVFCLENRQLTEVQVLVRAERSYLCAPRGQLVEGFLAIAPYRCIGCLTQLPAHQMGEISALQDRVLAFYAWAYAAGSALFYEQGRAGGGARRDAAGEFPLHAHLCSLPVAANPRSKHMGNSAEPPAANLANDLAERLIEYLAGRYLAVRVARLHDLASTLGARPYLYVESHSGSCGSRPPDSPDAAAPRRVARVAFVGRTAAQDAEIARARLKPVLAKLLGRPGQGDWRSHPGNHGLASLLARWQRHRASEPGSDRRPTPIAPI